MRSPTDKGILGSSLRSTFSKTECRVHGLNTALDLRPSCFNVFRVLSQDLGVNERKRTQDVEIGTGRTRGTEYSGKLKVRGKVFDKDV